MKLVRLHLREVEGPAAGAVAGRRAVARRRGLLLELQASAGGRGLGECSPLPGYSPDRLADCCAALAGFARTLPRTVAPETTAIEAVVAELPALLPAARAGLEAALLDLAGQALGVPVWALLAPGADTVALAALVPEADADVAAVLWAQGFRTFKVKVGSEADLEPVLARLDGLRRRHGAGLRLRLDANGGWTVAEARRILDRLAALGPELVEQPVAPGLLAELIDSPVPLAADESLQRPGGLAEALASCRALVLKPMVLGGLLPCTALARRGAEGGLAAVVSHLFDGPVALAAAAHLAVVLASPLAAGLAPHAGLAAWPAAGMPSFDGALLHPPTAPGLELEPAP